MKKRHYSATAGIEWAGAIGELIYNQLHNFSLLEFIPENFSRKDIVPYRERLFNKIKELEIPIIIHFTQLSLGSVEKFKKTHWETYFEICKELPIQSWTDHLCFTEMNGVSTGQLTPVFYNDDTLKAICSKVSYIQSKIDAPFAIENIAAGFQLASQQYEETEFIDLMHQKTGSGLVLDLNNLYVNGENFNIDPYDWIKRVDPSIVDSVHLAGGFMDGDQFMQDGHNARVPSEVWDLYKFLLKYCDRPLPTIVERTGANEDGLEPIVADINKANQIMDHMFSENNSAQSSDETSYLYA